MGWLIFGILFGLGTLFVFGLIGLLWAFSNGWIGN